MSIRTKILGLVDVIMRIPPLFLIDELLKINMNLPEQNEIYFLNLFESDQAVENELNQTASNLTDPLIDENSINFYVFAVTILKCLLCLFGE